MQTKQTILRKHFLFGLYPNDFALLLCNDYNPLFDSIAFEFSLQATLENALRIFFLEVLAKTNEVSVYGEILQATIKTVFFERRHFRVPVL